MQRDLGALDKGPDSFGLVHADLHMWNVLTADGVGRPIDFDDCGFGWLAFDWAVTSIWSLGHPNAEAAKDAWLEGYERVRPFPAEQREAFDLMVLARTFEMLGWVASRADHPRIHARLPFQLRAVLARGDAYRKGRSLATLELHRS